MRLLLGTTTIGLLCCTATWSQDTLIVPGVRVGPLAADTTEAELVSLYGRDGVIDHNFSIGEGYVCDGARIEIGDDQTLDIAWRDRVNRSGISGITINSEIWNTKEGLRVGLTLAEVERLNNGPLTITGFGWDYGGVVASWEQGRLAPVWPNGERLVRTWFRATLESETANHDDYAATSGDRVFSSEHPSLHKLNPSIYQLDVYLGDRRCEQYYFDAL